MEKIKDFLRDAAIPIAGGIIGAFIGMGIAILLAVSGSLRKTSMESKSQQQAAGWR